MFISSDWVLHHQSYTQDLRRLAQNLEKNKRAGVMAQPLKSGLTIKAI